MKTERYQNCTLDLAVGKGRAHAFGHPLEFEMAGKVFRGGFRPAGGGRYRGLLADEAGIFLSCDVVYRRVRLGGRPVLCETRTYRAWRNLDRALLTVRFGLEPVKKPQEGFLVIPALWYGDNEDWHQVVDYPRGLDQDWSFRADGSSCPAVVWTTPRGSYAVAVRDSVDWKGGRAGVDDILGVGFAGFPAGPQAVFTFPAQEVPRQYRKGRAFGPSLAPRLDWKKGTVLTLEFRHHAGPSKRDFHVDVWKAHQSGAPRGIRYPEKDLESTARLFQKCMKESHFVPGKGFKHRNDIDEIFSGWCGGFAAAYAAIRRGESAGDPEFTRMGETMCEYLCRNGISPSGLFYSENLKGVWLIRTFWGNGKGLPSRNPSEGSSYLALILEHERRHGRFRPVWEQALRRNLDAVLGLQRRDGAIPNEVDGRTGRPITWTGATPGTWAGALAVYSRIDPDRARARRYLRAAERCAAYYLKNYVERERYVGGPYDAYMAPNMEDPYNLLMAYSELYGTTGKRRWLDAAKRTADHLLSWRYVYDVRFPDATVCREFRVRTYAMSPASVSNKHIQNWDTLGDVYLLKLARWLGDSFYRDAAVQHLRASTQLVQTGRLPKGIPPGGQSEQWYATEFFWFGNCGRYGKGNLWQVSVVLPKAGFLLALEELKKSPPRPQGPK